MPGRSKYSCALSLKSSAANAAAGPQARARNISRRIGTLFATAFARPKSNSTGCAKTLRLLFSSPRLDEVVHEAQLLQHARRQHEGIGVLETHAAIEAVQRERDCVPVGGQRIEIAKRERVG